MHRFAEIVNDGGLSAPIRTPRDRDIFAAAASSKAPARQGREGAALTVVDRAERSAA
jgi:23S rRNA (adenine2503-C2)-methyltransferase